ncbi:MAG: hypothetical protein Q8S21_01565 [Candidatus Paracaedibacteraceae bacterium]|nr:hypothetical protein [Candidatus Paracaedibacteraceae bacterium]
MGYFSIFKNKNKLDRQNQILLLENIKGEYDKLFLINQKLHLLHSNEKIDTGVCEFSIESILKQITIYIDKYNLDEDVIDSLLEIGDITTYYIHGSFESFKSLKFKF